MQIFSLYNWWFSVTQSVLCLMVGWLRITKWIGYEKIWPWFLSYTVTIKLSGASKNLSILVTRPLWIFQPRISVMTKCKGFRTIQGIFEYYDPKKHFNSTGSLTWLYSTHLITHHPLPPKMIQLTDKLPTKNFISAQQCNELLLLLL